MHKNKPDWTKLITPEMAEVDQKLLHISASGMRSTPPPAIISRTTWTNAYFGMMADRFRQR